MFHADPHAGNVRLVLDPDAPGGAKPVLLDWGLIREITDAERLGLAKVREWWDRCNLQREPSPMVENKALHDWRVTFGAG